MQASGRQRLFIYERKEAAILVLLALMVAIFAFTLGVHLGKKVGVKPELRPSEETKPVATTSDKLPNSAEIAEQNKGLQGAIDETLNQEIHDEVTRTGIRLETPRQVKLPEQAKTKNAGATDLDNLEGDPSSGKTSGASAFSLQIGSFPSLSEAEGQINRLKKSGLNGFYRVAEIPGKGKWYRVFVGGYSTKESAEKAGQHYRNEHIVSSYIVAKTPK